MKFLKINFLLFALISLSTTVAQTKDPKAKQWLNEVNEKVNTYKNIQISFFFLFFGELKSFSKFFG